MLFSHANKKNNKYFNRYYLRKHVVGVRESTIRLIVPTIHEHLTMMADNRKKNV